MSAAGDPRPHRPGRRLDNPNYETKSDAYGLTETVSGDVFIDREHGSKLGSVGRPVPHTRVRIVDDTGNEVPAGELGEITCAA
ncbi:AMP-binding protein [Streptomyces sp. NPDC002896]|uniref:AMP-binding protein n=1 Tax=Streptomyces sp. NPDC002896 TaxID=3154438 RepID=UPI00331D56BB